MQNAFIAHLLTRPAPPPEAVLLDTPAAEPLIDENIEMHDSALFDPPIVEIDFFDGRRIRIPQQSTPADWSAPF
jgi:hypothetical protein